MNEIQILIPKPEEQLRPWQAEAPWYQKMVDRWNPPFELPNIRFHYDHDDFFNRVFSIRAARDWRHSPFWFYVAILFFLGQMAAMGIGLSFRIIKPFIPELDLPDIS